MKRLRRPHRADDTGDTGDRGDDSDAIYYRHSEEVPLRFDGGTRSYLNDACREQLCDDEYALLEQLTHLGHFVDAVLQECTQEEEGEGEMRDEGLQSFVTMALSVAWRWHSELALRPQEMTGLYAHARLLSWAAVCQLFWATLMLDREYCAQVHTQRLQDFEYGQALARHYSVEISDEPVACYSMLDVWDSMALCLDSFYRFAYSEQQKLYLYALFYRYCALSTVGCTPEEDPSLVLDNPLLVQWHDGREPDSDDASDEDDEVQFDGYKRVVRVRVCEQASLRSAYLYEGELLFYAQLHRVVLSERLQQMADDAPLLLAEPVTPQIRALALDAWLVTCRVVCLHKELRQFIVEDYKSLQMQLYLYHGELERFKHKWPESNCGAGDVLGMLRSTAHMEALRLQQVMPGSLCTAFYRQVRRDEKLARVRGEQVLYEFEQDALPSNAELEEQLRRREQARVQHAGQQQRRDEQPEDGDYEKEALLVTRQVTLRWLTYMGVRKELLEPLVVMEEMHSTQELDQLLGRSERLKPTLLRLMRWYCVLHEGRVYRTRHLIDAYCVWLQRLVTADLVPVARLYNEMRECVPQFMTL